MRQSTPTAALRKSGQRHLLRYRMAAVSPICEFGILAARARSTENAAIAKSSVPPRGGKTGHSCKAQQDKSVELTDCGQTGPSLKAN
jgi:hypothetical protein